MTWKLLYGKITQYLAQKIRKMLVRGLNENKNSTFDSGPLFTRYRNSNSISEIDNCIESKLQWQINPVPEWNIELPLT